MKVFVYGTLRKGEAYHHILQQSPCLAEHCWTQGELHDTGYGYPVLKEHFSKKVYGELYEITTSILIDLDRLEDYDPAGSNSLYVRQQQTVFTEAESYDALVYVAGEELAKCSSPIKSGDWKQR